MLPFEIEAVSKNRNPADNSKRNKIAPTPAPTRSVLRRILRTASIPPTAPPSIQAANTERSIPRSEIIPLDTRSAHISKVRSAIIPAYAPPFSSSHMAASHRPPFSSGLCSLRFFCGFLLIYSPSLFHYVGTLCLCRRSLSYGA